METDSMRRSAALLCSPLMRYADARLYLQEWGEYHDGRVSPEALYMAVPRAGCSGGKSFFFWSRASVYASTAAAASPFIVALAPLFSHKNEGS